MKFKFKGIELGSFAYDLYRYVGEEAEVTVEVDKETYLKMLDGLIADPETEKKGIAKVMKVLTEEAGYEGNANA